MFRYFACAWPALLTVALCCFALPGVAQADFQPGYVVTLAGDTLRGQLDFRGPAYNSKHCRYRSARGAEPQAYVPAEVRSYYTAGRYYVPLPWRPDAAGLRFVEVLAGPVLTVVFGVDSLGKDRFFLLPAPGEPDVVELIRTPQRRRSSSGQILTGYDETFRYTLTSRLTAAGCQPTPAQVRSWTLGYSQLRHLAAAYNSCAMGAARVRQSRRTAHAVYVLAGGTTVPGYHPGYYEILTPGQLAGAYGLEWQLTPQRYGRRGALALGWCRATATDFAATTSFANVVAGVQAYHYRVRSHLNRLSFSARRFFALRGGPVRAFGEAGIGLCFFEDKATVTELSPVGVVSVRQEAPPNTGPQLVVGGGLDAGRWRLLLRGQVDWHAYYFGAWSGTAGVGYAFIQRRAPVQRL